MGVEFFYLNFFIGLLFFSLLTKSWLLVPFLAAFEVLWVSLAYAFALQSLYFNDLFLLFVAIAVLFLSAAELVFAIGTLLLIYNKQRQAIL